MKMRIKSWSLLMACSVSLLSLAGCGGEEQQVSSMTEGVPLSEIEAYEQAVLAMEAEDAGAMDIDENAAEPAPAE